ncbi:zinc finger, CCHC-type, retrotransposon gag domain protein [Tanacetum coccineum]
MATIRNKEVLKETTSKHVGTLASNGSWKDKTTYRDFTACDVPKFTSDLNPITSIRWITDVKGKMCEKGENWVSSCTWKEFKEMFNAEYASVEEIDKIREEFHSLMQTNETVNELWKKFNDMIPYCPEYIGNEKLKVDRFQRMLKDEIREVISPFKYTTLEDILGRARIREVDLLRKRNNE